MRRHSHLTRGFPNVSWYIQDGSCCTVQLQYNHFDNTNLGQRNIQCSNTISIGLILVDQHQHFMNILDFFDQDIQDRNFKPSLFLIFLIFQWILATFKYAKVSTKNPHFPPGGFHLIVAHHRQALLPTLTRAQQVLPMVGEGTGKKLQNKKSGHPRYAGIFFSRKYIRDSGLRKKTQNTPTRFWCYRIYILYI